MACKVVVVTLGGTSSAALSSRETSFDDSLQRVEHEVLAVRAASEENAMPAVAGAIFELARLTPPRENGGRSAI
jgi:hypothetical protein